MKLLLKLFIGCFTVSLGFSQLVFEKTKHQFGDLNEFSERFVDIKITNTGKKQEFLLRVQKPREVVYLTSGQFIEPDSSIFIRLQPNLKLTGKFAFEIEVFTSDKQVPTKIQITGNQKSAPSNSIASLQACPDFKARPTATDFKLTVATIDKNTKEILTKSDVSLIQNGRGIGSWKTDKTGKFTDKVPLGYTYFYATHSGYFPAEMGTYINFQRNYVVIELERNLEKEKTVIPNVPPTDTALIVEFPVQKQPEIILEQQLIFDTTTITENRPPIELTKIPINNFDPTYFKPVNVVFVLDISGSMRVGDRMELLKYSLHQLVDVLRPEDKMAIITYADKAKVLVSSKKGNQKEQLKTPINQLKADGYTAGGDGIKLGFKQMNKNFILEGTNLVIIITDGAFNKNSDAYKEIIERNKSKGVTFSVVGIQNTERDASKMKEAAIAGNGRYISIDKLADAQHNLIHEIRMASYRF